MDNYTEVDGVDYSPEAIEQIRKELGEHRAASMKVWPEGIAYSVLMTHVIALLDKLKVYEIEARATPQEVKPVKRATPSPAKTRTPRVMPPLPPLQGNG